MEEVYIYNGKEYTRAQLDQAARASGAPSTDAYISRYGIKKKESSSSSSSYNYNGKEYTGQQIEQAAKASGAPSADAYINKYGIKKVEKEKPFIAPLSTPKSNKLGNPDFGTIDVMESGKGKAEPEEILDIPFTIKNSFGEDFSEIDYKKILPNKKYKNGAGKIFEVNKKGVLENKETGDFYSNKTKWYGAGYTVPRSTEFVYNKFKSGEHLSESELDFLSKADPVKFDEVKNTYAPAYSVADLELSPKEVSQASLAYHNIIDKFSKATAQKANDIKLLRSANPELLNKIMSQVGAEGTTDEEIATSLSANSKKLSLNNSVERLNKNSKDNGLNLIFEYNDKVEPLVKAQETKKPILNTDELFKPEVGKVNLANNKEIEEWTNNIEGFIAYKKAVALQNTDFRGAGMGSVEMGKSVESKVELEMNPLRANQQLMSEFQVENIIKKAHAEGKLKPEYMSPDTVKNLGLEKLKIQNPETYKRVKKLLEEGEPLGSQMEFNIERDGNESLKRYLVSTGAPEEAIKAVDDLDATNETRHPEYTLSRALHKLGAINHYKDNGVSGGFWRTLPTISVVKKWLEDPEIASQFSKTELALLKEHLLKADNFAKEMGGSLLRKKDPFIDARIEVPLSGFLNEFSQAFESGAKGVKNIFTKNNSDRIRDRLNPDLGVSNITDVGTSQAAEARKYQLDYKRKTEGLDVNEEKEFTNLSRELDARSGWDKFVDGTGNLTGQVFMQAFLTRGIGLAGRVAEAGLGTRAALLSIGMESDLARRAISAATKLKPLYAAQGISGALISYDGVASDAAWMFPEEKDKWKRGFFTTAMVAANVLSEQFFQETKVIDAFGKMVRTDLQAILKKATLQNISKASLKDEVLPKVLSFIKKFGAENQKEAAEEVAVEITNQFLSSVMGSDSYDAYEAGQSIVDTWKTTTLYGGVTSALAARTSSARTGFGRRAIFDMAKNATDYKSEVERQYIAEEITKKEYFEKLKILGTARNFLATEPEKVAAMSDGKRAAFLTHQVNIAFNEDKIQRNEKEKEPSKKISKYEIAEIKDEIKKSTAEADKIYKGESTVDDEMATDVPYNQTTKGGRIIYSTQTGAMLGVLSKDNPDDDNTGYTFKKADGLKEEDAASIDQEVKERAGEAKVKIVEPATKIAPLEMSDEDLLKKLQDGSTKENIGDDLQHYINKAAEDPISLSDTHGVKAVRLLLSKAPIEKLKEKRAYVANLHERLGNDLSESEVIPMLDEAIAKIEATTKKQDSDVVDNPALKDVESKEVTISDGTTFSVIEEKTVDIKKEVEDSEWNKLSMQEKLALAKENLPEVDGMSNVEIIKEADANSKLLLEKIKQQDPKKNELKAASKPSLSISKITDKDKLGKIISYPYKNSKGKTVKAKVTAEKAQDDINKKMINLEKIINCIYG